jgi:hypothetical protein
MSTSLQDVKRQSDFFSNLPSRQEEKPVQQYNAHEHLLTWCAYNKKTGKTEVVQYYPAAWRLYELRLKFPTAKFEVDIIHMDVERDFCIVRARLWVGTDYETADVRSVAHKQGPLSELDKVETKCKARAARDLGISTELALDMDDTPENEVTGTVVTAEAPEQRTVETTPVKQLPKPATQEPEGKIKDGQMVALLKLYERMKQEPPADLQQWSFAKARATIIGLQGKTS